MGAAQDTRFTPVLNPRAAYDYPGGTLVGGDRCVTVTMDHGVQIKLLGPPALVYAPRAKRNRAECGGGTAPYGGG